MITFGIAVLAGGQGSRIGGDKPLRRLGASTLIERAARRARSWSAPTVLVLRSPDQASPNGLAVICDDPAIAGPLGGLAAALAWGASEALDAVLTVPCDMPFLPDDLPTRLSPALVAGINVAMAASGGRGHPICALWRPGVLDLLGERAGRGRLSLHGLAEQAGHVEVHWNAGDQDPFFNINTEADLAQAARREMSRAWRDPGSTAPCR